MTGTPGITTDEPIHIGPYRLLELLGEGGMGEVWLAEQSEPVHRRVALKIIKLGMDTKQVLARLEAERQALAVMDHPNIARFYDGGATETGRPYFVMELVRGGTLTDYCDINRLTTDERIRLFIDVCHAVQHAHHKGVVHRDLKPSNVLVTVKDSRPVVKIIDFGIAKALGQELTDQTLVTRMGQIIGTPEYMSPEQAEMSGVDVDTRTDVYSLGVMLYELMTGARPFDLAAKADQAIRIAIRETEVLRPSTRLTSLGETREAIAKHRRTTVEGLRKELRSDLDWVILKAMEKDRTRRYETANGLAQELDRHLRHEPVLAHAPSAGYRVRKFVKRHRMGVLATAAVAVALIAGLSLATMGMVRARRAERVAEEEAEAAKQVSDFLVELFEVSDPSESRGNTITAREVLDRGAGRIQSELENEPDLRSRLMATIARVYQGLGLYNEAASMSEAALTLRREEHGDDHPSVAESTHQLAELNQLLGRLEESEELFREALAIRESGYGRNHPAVASTLHGLAMLFVETAQFDTAEALYQRALTIREGLPGSDSTIVISTLNNLADLYREQGRYEEAESLFRRVLKEKEETLGDDHPSLATTLNSLAVLYRRMGRPAEAEPLYLRGLEIRENVLGPDHPQVAISLNSLGVLYVEMSRYEEAESLYWRSLEIKEADLGAEHPDVANTVNNIAVLYSMQGRLSEAEPLYTRALAIREAVFGPDHPSVAETNNNLGLISREQGKYAEAESYFQQAVATYEAYLGSDHPRLAGTLRNYAGLLRLLNREEEADRMEARADSIRG
jgi:tetratricopeptide (TPR) repeat protein